MTVDRNEHEDSGVESAVYETVGLIRALKICLHSEEMDIADIWPAMVLADQLEEKGNALLLLLDPVEQAKRRSAGFQPPAVC
jgi:hypothetical protein